MARARRTAIIPLEHPESDEHARLQHTQTKYQYCQNQAADYCWPDTPKQPDDLVTSKGDAEDALYHELRDDTDEQLHGNLVQKAIKDTTSAMSTLQTHWENGWRISKPEWSADADDWTMTYDTKAATIKRYEVQLATLGDPVTLQYETPADLDNTTYGKYIVDYRWQIKSSKLVYRYGRYWLHVSVARDYQDTHWAHRDEVTDEYDEEVSNTPTEDTIRVLGVDLNVKGSTAVTSAGGFHGNADYLNHRRSEYENTRAQLQQTATRSANQRFHEIVKSHANWLSEYEWLVINGIVEDAIRTRATHVVFETLDGIRDRMSNLPKYQQWMFKRIQEEVEAQLEPYGVDVDTIDPRNTSKECSHTECGHVADANRAGKEFECVECGLALNADYNAARNIGVRYFEENVPASQTRSSGRVTCQLALVSGVLAVREDTSNGARFSSMDWMSTDKPTALAVGS